MEYGEKNIFETSMFDALQLTTELFNRNAVKKNIVIYTYTFQTPQTITRYEKYLTIYTKREILVDPNLYSINYIF